MKAIGARMARAVNRVADRTGRVFADRYHVRMLPTPREVHRALRYVLLNARQHVVAAARTLMNPVRLDPASSARWFDGWKRGVAIEGGVTGSLDQRPSVTHALTWLLAVGWRRHGLIDPRDAPG